MKRALALAACLAVRIVPTYAADSRWVEVASPHYLVISNLGQREASTYVRDFEMTRAVLQQLLAPVQIDAIPPRVLAVAGQPVLKSLVPSAGRGAMVASISARRSIAVDVWDGQPAIQIMQVDMDEVFRRIGRARPTPYWLREGWRHLWSSARIDDMGVWIAPGAPWRLERLKGKKYVPLATFLDVQERSPELQKKNLFEVYDDQTWAFIHFLALKDFGANQKFGQFVQRLLDGEEQRAALQDTYGALDAVEAEYRAYVRRKSFKDGIRMPVTVAVDAFVTRRIPEGEVRQAAAIFGPLTQEPGKMSAELRALRALDGPEATVAGFDPKGWLEVRSQHFNVVSNSGDAVARHIAWRLEQLHRPVQSLLPWAKLPPGRSFTVLATKDAATFDALASSRRVGRTLTVGAGSSTQRPSQSPASVSAAGIDRWITLLDAGPERADLAHVAAHRDYVGMLLDRSSTSIAAVLPPWLRTGLVELLGGATFEGARVHVGVATPQHAAALKNGEFLSLSTLLEFDPRTVRDQQQWQMFGVQSWGLTNYLLFGAENASVARFSSFVDQLRAGVPHETALIEAFGDVRALEQAYRSYLKGPEIKFAAFDFDSGLSPETFTSRPLGVADAVRTPAVMFALSHETAVARALLAMTALSWSPSTAADYEIEALLKNDTGDPKGSLAAYARAAKLGSTSFWSHLQRAQSLRTKAALEPDGAAGLLADARASVLRSLHLHSDFPPAYLELAAINEALGDKDAARAAIQAALQQDPNYGAARAALEKLPGSGPLPEAGK